MKQLMQGKVLLFIAAAITMLLVSGIGIGGRIREATNKLKDEMAVLETERDRLQKIEDSRADYQAQTARFDASFAEVTKRFPAEISQNNQILFLKGVEDEFNIRIASASYTEPEEIYSFQVVSPGNQNSYSLVRSTLQFPMQLSYDEWKRFIAYIQETEGRDVIESVTANYDTTESMVDADVTISQYAITGEDRKDAEQTTDVEVGTDNIFSSTIKLSTGTYDEPQSTSDSGAGYGDSTGSYGGYDGYITDNESVNPESVGDAEPGEDTDATEGGDASSYENTEGAENAGENNAGGGVEGNAEDGTNSGIRSSLR